MYTVLNSQLNFIVLLENDLLRMTRKSKAVLKKHIFTEKSNKAGYKNDNYYLYLLN
jgi:hypothetical protein